MCISAPCEQIDIIFILDTSGSINDVDPMNFGYMQSFVKSFAAQYSNWGIGGVQMGVVLLGNTGRLVIQLNSNTDVESFQTEVDLLVYRGERANIQSALDVTRTMAFMEMVGGRPDAYKAVVFITDGDVQTPEFGPLDDTRLTELRDSGVEVFVIANTAFVTRPNIYSQLAMIATEDVVPPEEHFLAVTDFTSIMELVSVFAGAIDTTCQAEAETAPGVGELRHKHSPPRPAPATHAAH